MKRIEWSDRENWGWCDLEQRGEHFVRERTLVVPATINGQTRMLSLCKNHFYQALPDLDQTSERYQRAEQAFEEA